jgi:single-stranded-DNA-specific exonuclease
MLPITRWKLFKTNTETQNLLTKELGIHPLISRILINRDISAPDDAKKFLFPSLADLHNPFLMKDMEKGVDRMISAILNHEKIVIYGDYDVDGITSVAILVKFLKTFYENVTYYIPDRIKEGYGLNKKAIDKIKEDKADLIITVDCGVSDYEEVRYANSNGVDIIITDHHEVPAVLPDATAVINPNQSDCRFPFGYLAGVGVAFNFLIAVRGKLRDINFWDDGEYPNLRKYLDLVALGTIGDMVPLIDENRILAKIGLDVINEKNRTGIETLRAVSGSGNSMVDSEAASFKLIPRINAAGRIGSPEDAVELLITDDVDKAKEIAKKLDSYNRERKEIESNILNEALGKIEVTIEDRDIKSVVFASPEWHPGVIGIVASKIVDRYCLPTILISLKDGTGKGSGRSIAGFDLYKELKDKCSSLLISYGGHRHAAGISIKEENIEGFSKLFNEAAQNSLTDSDTIPKTLIDVECDLKEIDRSLISQIEILAPFGNMNPEPVFCIKNVKVTSSTVVGGNHLRMLINKNNASCGSIWFNKGHFSNILSDSTADIVFRPQINYWNGESNTQLKIKDALISES